MAKKNTNNLEDLDVVETTDNTVLPVEVETPVEEVVQAVKVRKTEPNYNASHIPVAKVRGMLVSRLNNPVYIAYGNSSLLLPPRGKMFEINPEMLGSLPKGVDFVVK